jgi:hypothetical protein
VTGFLIIGSLPVALVCAVASAVCLFKRRYGRAALLFLPVLWPLLLLLSLLHLSGVETDSFVSAQDVVGTWGSGSRRVTFHEDGSAVAADGTHWSWERDGSSRNRFMMSSVNALVPERCFIGLRKDDEVLLLPEDCAFADPDSWYLGDALHRRE